MKLLIFDIDGTLLLGGGVGRIAFNSAIEDVFGIADTWGNTVAHGKTDPQLVKEIITRETGREPSPSENDQFFERYVGHFAKHIDSSPRFRVLGGVSKLLETLHPRADLMLGIGTGNIETTAKLKLKKGKLEHFFSFGGFGSDSIHRAELLRSAVDRGCSLLSQVPEEIIVIGDAPQDVHAGQAVGARVIAVATGRASVDELRAEGAEHVLSNLEDQQAFLELV